MNNRKPEWIGECLTYYVHTTEHPAISDTCAHTSRKELKRLRCAVVATDLPKNWSRSQVEHF